MIGKIVTLILLTLLTVGSAAMFIWYKHEQKELRQAETERRLILQKQEILKRKLTSISEERRLLSAVPHVPVLKEKGNKLKKNLIGDMPEVKLSDITAESVSAGLGNFVVIGIITTGKALNRSKIVELSAVRFRDFKPIEVFATLINPKRPIPAESVEINGITPEMVKESPFLQQVSNRFIKFVGGSAVVGHDIVFIMRHLFHNGIDLSRNKKYCTCALAREVIPKENIDDYTLTALCEHYGITIIQSHRAEYEALAAGHLFKKLADEITSE